jgi:hypothetical protein
VPAGLKLTISQVGDQRIGVANDAFWGIQVKPNTAYKASFCAKASSRFAGAITVAIVGNDGNRCTPAHRCPGPATCGAGTT